MEDKIKELALTRKDLEYAKRVLAETESRLMDTEIGLQVLQLKTVVKALAEEEKAIRDGLDSEALQIYVNEGDKHPHPAVTIKENNKLEYEPDKAIAWALETKQMGMISLNKTVFEKAAKALEFEFVKKYKEPSVTVSTDLSAYIETPGIE